MSRLRAVELAEQLAARLVVALDLLELLAHAAAAPARDAGARPGRRPTCASAAVSRFATSRVWRLSCDCFSPSSPTSSAPCCPVDSRASLPGFLHIALSVWRSSSIASFSAAFPLRPDSSPRARLPVAELPTGVGEPRDRLAERLAELGADERRLLGEHTERVRDARDALGEIGLAVRALVDRRRAKKGSPRLSRWSETRSCAARRTAARSTPARSFCHLLRHLLELLRRLAQALARLLSALLRLLDLFFCDADWAASCCGCAASFDSVFRSLLGLRLGSWLPSPSPAPRLPHRASRSPSPRAPAVRRAPSPWHSAPEACRLDSLPCSRLSSSCRCLELLRATSPAPELLLLRSLLQQLERALELVCSISLFCSRHSGSCFSSARLSRFSMRLLHLLQRLAELLRLHLLHQLAPSRAASASSSSLNAWRSAAFSMLLRSSCAAWSIFWPSCCWRSSALLSSSLRSNAGVDSALRGPAGARACRATSGAPSPGPRPSRASSDVGSGSVDLLVEVGERGKRSSNVGLTARPRPARPRCRRAARSGTSPSRPAAARAPTRPSGSARRPRAGARRSARAEASSRAPPDPCGTRAAARRGRGRPARHSRAAPAGPRGDPVARREPHGDHGRSVGERADAVAERACAARMRSRAARTRLRARSAPRRASAAR